MSLVEPKSQAPCHGQSPVVKVEDDFGPRPCKFPPKEPARETATAADGGHARLHEASSEALEDSKDAILSGAREEFSASRVAGELGHSPSRRTVSHAQSASSREESADRTDLHVQGDSKTHHSMPGCTTDTTPAGKTILADKSPAEEASAVDAPVPVAPNSTTDQPEGHSRDPELPLTEQAGHAYPELGLQSDYPIVLESAAGPAEIGRKRSLDDLGIEMNDQGGKRRKNSNAGNCYGHETGASNSLPVERESAPPGPARSGTEKSAVVEIVRTPQTEASSSTPKLAQTTGTDYILGLVMANAWRRYDQYQGRSSTALDLQG